MEQRSVLISGCSSGIGRCVAEGLKARGYRVFATARKQQDVDALIKQGFESCQLDLTDSGSIKAAVEKVLNACGGKIYGLFINASKYAIEGLTDTLRQELDGSGIYVSIINTWPVTSNFRENAY